MSTRWCWTLSRRANVDGDAEELGHRLAATVSPTTLTFTKLNWSTAQSGDGDGGERRGAGRPDGESSTHAAAGGGYSLTGELTAVTVTVTNDDVAALTVSETADTVAEAAGKAHYRVKLAKKPTDDVTVTPTSSDINAATVSPATLTFTQSDVEHGPDGDGDGGEQRHPGRPDGERDARGDGGRLLADEREQGRGDGGGRRRGADDIAEHADGGRGGGYGDVHGGAGR